MTSTKMANTLNTASAVVADLWDRAVAKVEGGPRADTPTAFSTEARWDAVIRRVDGAVIEPALTTAAAEVSSAWDRVLTLVNGDDPTTVGRPLGPVVGPARQEEWWR